MILSCPDCATRYFVGDDAVPAEGRVVRCASCAAEWRAFPEAPEPLTLAASSPADPAAAARPPPLPAAIRAKARAQRQTMSAVAAGAVWGGLGAGLAALLGLAVLFRVDVVRLWPRTAGAYAAVKLPVNPVGLSPEGVTGGPGLQNGRAVTMVSGMLRNVTAGPRAAIPLRVALFDKAGRRLASQVVSPLGGPIAPGDARAFQATFVDPPLDAAEFGVDFAFDAPRPPGRPSRARPGAPAAPPRNATAPPPPSPGAGPAPPAVEARALPADSPYALHTPHG